MRRSNKLRQQAIAIGGVIFLAAVVFGFLSRERLQEKVVAGEPSTPAVQTLESRTQLISEQARETGWRKFQSEFGSSLNPTFTPDRRLVRVRAGENMGKPADHFSSGDQDAALARAQEILRNAGGLLGLNPDYPLQARAVRADEISSQIEWVQAYRGVQIEPFGRITLQLDSEGGLHGLYSNYISDPVIVNHPQLDDSSARTLAFSHLHFEPDRPLQSGQAPKGDLVLFAPGPQDSSQPIELRYAYRYWVSGHEVIVDAANGDILSEKDRRQF